MRALASSRPWLHYPISSSFVGAAGSVRGRDNILFWGSKICGAAALASAPSYVLIVPGTPGSASVEIWLFGAIRIDWAVLDIAAVHSRFPMWLRPYSARPATWPLRLVQLLRLRLDRGHG